MWGPGELFPCCPSGSPHCVLRGKTRVGNGFVALKIPPGQGDSGCLVESLSWISQLSAREACLSKMLTDMRRQSHARLTVNRTWSCCQLQRGPWLRKAPPVAPRAKPPYSTELQGCRKSTIKTQMGPRSFSPRVSPPDVIANCLVFRWPEKPTVTLN